MDFIAQYKQQRAELETRDAVAKASGDIVGRFIEHPIADGHAVYLITKKNARTVRIEHVNIGDAWVVPAWGKNATIALDKAEGFLQRRDMLSQLFQRTDNWWTNQMVGDTVHYNYGHGQFVRGVIVIHEKGKKMMPTALIGNWSKFDVARRMPNGSVHYGTYVTKIHNREPMQPNASNMVEYDLSKYAGSQDPRKMTPVHLGVPEMTKTEKTLADALQLHQQVISALACKLTDNDLENYELVMASLRRAARIINEGVSKV